MKVEQLEVPKEKAQAEFEALKQVFKEHRQLKDEQMLRDLRSVYGHMRHGGKVIDVWGAFKDAGLNREGKPKLAIVRADSKIVVFNGYTQGYGKFQHDRGRGNSERYWQWQTNKADIQLPESTYQWLRDENGRIQIPSRIEAPVPIIPPRILIDKVKHQLKNYYIIWEVEEWRLVAPKDPILAKRLTPNLFGVLATWDLTELERRVIQARL